MRDVLLANGFRADGGGPSGAVRGVRMRPFGSGACGARPHDRHDGDGDEQQQNQ
jgi:hypothetical protein